MDKYNFERVSAVILSAAMVLSGTLISVDAAGAAAKEPAFVSKEGTVDVGKTVKVKINNLKKKNVKDLAVKSSDTTVATAVKSGKTAIRVTGVADGTAKIKVTVKLKKAVNKKKSYKLTYNATVKTDTIGTGTEEPTSTPGDTTGTGTVEPTSAPVGTGITGMPDESGPSGGASGGWDGEYNVGYRIELCEGIRDVKVRGQSIDDFKISKGEPVTLILSNDIEDGKIVVVFYAKKDDSDAYVPVTKVSKKVFTFTMPGADVYVDIEDGITITGPEPIEAVAGSHGAYAFDSYAVAEAVADGQRFKIAITCLSLDPNNQNGERVTVTYGGYKESVVFKKEGVAKHVKFDAMEGYTTSSASVEAVAG